MCLPVDRMGQPDTSIIASRSDRSCHSHNGKASFASFFLLTLKSPAGADAPQACYGTIDMFILPHRSGVAGAVFFREISPITARVFIRSAYRGFSSRDRCESGHDTAGTRHPISPQPAECLPFAPRGATGEIADDTIAHDVRMVSSEKAGECSRMGSLPMRADILPLFPQFA